MRAEVKRLTKKETILKIGTRQRVRELTIKESEGSYHVTDFLEWNMNDSQFYRLEGFIEVLIDMMRDAEEMEISFEMKI